MTTRILIGVVLAALLVWGLIAFLGEREGTHLEGGRETEVTREEREARRVRGEGKVSEETPAEKQAQKEEVDGAHEADTAAEAPTTGALVVLVTWKDSGQPVAGIPIKLMVWAGPNPYANEIHATSDQAGRYANAALPAGRVSVLVQDKYHRAEVEGGEASVLEVALKPGVRTHGLVVDEDERGIAGAGIWVGGLGGEGFIVTKTDEKGRFDTKLVTPSTWQCVGARHPEYAPSTAEILLAEPGTARELRIVLKGRGTTVRGRVVDRDDRPVTGARVIVGPESTKQMRLASGASALRAFSIRLRTDDEGRFEARGVAPGKGRVQVRATEELAPRVEAHEFVAGKTLDLAIVLPPCVTLVGRVTDRNGNPLAKAAIEVNGFASLDDGYAKTDDEGRYRMSGLAPGPLRLEAKYKTYGKVRDTLTAFAGETHTWDVVMDEGLTIAGRVLDDGGRPFVGWWISAVGRAADDDWEHRSATTDDQGRFEMKGCRDIEYRLEVHMKGSGTEVATRETVRPSDGEQLFTVEVEAIEAVIVKGRIVDREGKPVTNARISATRAGANSSPVFASDTEGRFSHKSPPGEYTLFIRAPGHPQLRKTYTVGTETHDLGDIRIPAGGRLRVTLRGDYESIGSIRLLGPEKLSVSLKREGSTAFSMPLLPGPWRLRIFYDVNPPVAPIVRDVEIRAGDEEHVYVDV